MDTILDDGENEKHMCSEDTSGYKGKDWGEEEKKLCKILLRIFFWMDGLKQKWEPGKGYGSGYFGWIKSTDQTSEEGKVKSYYRCLLGKVTMLNMLGKHCAMEKVAKVVKNKMGAFRVSMIHDEGNQLCKNVNVKDFMWGRRLIWEQVKEWIDKYKRDGTSRESLAKALSAVTPKNSLLHRIKEEGEEKCPGGKKKENISKEILQNLEMAITAEDDVDINEDSEPLDKGVLDKVLEEVQKVVDTDRTRRKQDHNEEELKGEVHAAVKRVTQKYETPPQQGGECKEGAPCTRPQCIANKWVKNRTSNENEPPWGNFWTDIETELENLLKEIPQKKGHVEKYCNNDKWEMNANGEAKKAACKLIAAGLHHMYSIQLSFDQSSEKNPFDNQEFKQFASCLLLKDLAEQMEKTCPHSKAGIKQAFHSWQQIKTTVCTKPPCVECKMDDTYGNCQLKKDNGTTVEKKLEEVFNKKNSEVIIALNEIDPICTTAKPAPASQTPDKSSTKDPMDAEEKKFIDKLSEETVDESYINEFASACEKESKGMDGLKGDVSEDDKKFCRVLLRNYIITTIKDDNDILGIKNANSWTIDQTTRCKILNPWLKHYGEQKCDPGEMYEYIKKKVEGLIQYTPLNRSYKKCEYRVDNDTHSNGIDPSPNSKEEQWKEEIHNGIKNMNLENSCGQTIYGSDTKDTAKNGKPDSYNVDDKSEAGGSAPAARDEESGGSGAGDELSAPSKGGPLSVPASDKGARVSRSSPGTTIAQPVVTNKDNPVLSYLPLAPITIGIITLTYLFWKYFGILGKIRRRYRRAYQVRGPTVEGQPLDHVDQDGDPHAYTIVKERKPSSTPIKRRNKRGVDHRAGRRRGVRRRMIIDIHLEVLDECQKGATQSVQNDFFEILVREFMGCEFIKGQNVPMEQVLNSDLGF
ncbi:SICA antigen [Plasmodium coatneyi]|uniref:SICA antigen n=1 Tax=Plasmodium coatneyi TaxID=208452 RepID=A0A1B1E437_9APIC|nr:SICA antigen [Plasmodium coatneyi]ANQ09782.1 SICA antigen [Plasmodium coatneyi]